MSVNSSARTHPSGSRPRSSSNNAVNLKRKGRRIQISDDEMDDPDYDEKEDDNDEDDDEENDADGRSKEYTQHATQDLLDFPNLHESFRDMGLCNVVQMMKRQNGGVTYVLPYQSEFQRCVQVYKEDGDDEFIHQLFAFIAILCFDRCHTAGIMRGKDHNDSYIIFM